MSERLPPGPRAPAALQILAWLRDTFGVLDECHVRYGDTFTLRWPHFGTCVHFSDPDTIREIFTTERDELLAGEGNAFLGPLLGEHSIMTLDGPRHRRQRKLVMPALHGEFLHASATTMLDRAAREFESWPRGEPFAILPSMRALALDIILRTVFGLDGSDPRHPTLRARLEALTRAGESPILLMPPLHRDLGRWSPWGRFVRVVRDLDEALFAEIEARMREGDPTRHDVLSIFLAARDDEGTPLSDREIRDELVTLLVTGHETTAAALAWVVERLVRHPEVLARARDEVHRVCGDGPVTGEDVARLPYLDAVVCETLRTRTVVPLAGRRLSRPRTVGGWSLPAGIGVVANIYLAHHRAATYPDARSFRPERFVDRRPDPFTWFPFGGGTRRCVGMAMALFETKTVLAQLLHAYELRTTTAPDESIARRGIVLVPANGGRVVIDAARVRSRASLSRDLAIRERPAVHRIADGDGEVARREAFEIERHEVRRHARR